MNNESAYSDNDDRRLVINSDHPEEIAEYLKIEGIIISNIINSTRCLVELGCMWGRYAAECLKLDRFYRGIDYSSTYIRSALEEHSGHQEKVQFLVADISEWREDFASVVAPVTGIESSKVVLPFNMLGNVTDLSGAVRNLETLRCDIFIFGYRPSPHNIEVIKNYLSCSGHHVNLISENSEMIAFSDERGEFNTRIILDHWFSKNFSRPVHASDFGAIGRVWALPKYDTPPNELIGLGGDLQFHRISR